MIPFTAPWNVQIRQLNDDLRIRSEGGLFMVSKGIVERGAQFAARCIQSVVAYDQWPAECDIGLGDFGVFEIEDVRVEWRISYLDKSMIGESPDATDPEVTSRVLLVCLESEA